MSKRIAQPPLDVGVRVQRGEDCVEPARVVVVELEPNADAAVSRSTECLEEQAARQVIMTDVVLHVERMLGGIGEEHARRKRVASIAQRNDAALPGVIPDERQHGLAESRLRLLDEWLTCVDDRDRHGSAPNEGRASNVRKEPLPTPKPT